MSLRNSKRKWIDRSGDGSVTIYLLLIFVVILSLITALIEGARVKETKAEVSVAAGITRENIAASYCLELFEDYGIFYYHGTEMELQETLQESMEKNLISNGMFGARVETLELQEIQNATEENGEDFRKQAVTYMKESLPKEWVNDWKKRNQTVKEEKTESFEEKVEKQEAYAPEKELKKVQKTIKKVIKKNKKKSLKKSPKKFKEVMEKAIQEALQAITEFEQAINGKLEGESYITRDKKILEDALEECRQIEEEQKKLKLDQKRYRIDQLELPQKEKKESVIDDMKNLIKDGKLSLVIPKGTVISKREVKTELPSHAYQKRKKSISSEEKVLFSEFCKRHFGNYTAEKDTHLKYELEYLIAGKKSDKDNLSKVVDQLILLREACNLAEIIADGKKRMECQEMAIAIAGWTGIPAMITVTKGLVMAAWALGESIVDVKNLLKGGKVPLKKGREDWQTQLSGLTKLNEKKESKKGKKGFTYLDYLQILLCKENVEQVTMRSMDLIQMDLEKRYRVKFRFEHCVKNGKYICTYQCKKLFSQDLFPYHFKQQYGF